MDGTNRAADVSGTGTRAKLRPRFDAQRAAFVPGGASYEVRSEALRSLERALVARSQDLCRAVHDDFGGRAFEETLALEIIPTLNEVRYALKHLRRWMSPKRAAVPWQFLPARAWVRYEPLGVVGILATWNYPVFLSFGPLVGALAAGNQVMIKPSELAPATAELMREIMTDLFPAERVAVITGDEHAAAEFAHLPFDRLLFTGSARVAKGVLRAASENLTPVTLELGGKCPAIVHETYSLRLAAERIMTGKLYNAGQTCVAPDYALLPETRMTEFVRACQVAATRLYPTIAANPDYTRIINSAQYFRLTQLVEDARSLGARILQVNPAGEACSEENRVFPPTLVLEVTDGMRIAQEEIFGPILPVVSYRSLGEAFAYVNARPRPLALYYFDTDSRRARQVTAGVRAGGITLNDSVFHVGVPSLPFGGTGPSGMGQYHGFDGFETFSKKQGVLEQRRWSPQSLVRPPYGDRARRILRWLVR